MPCSSATYANSVSAFLNIAYVLEMEQGWFAKNNVLPGVRLTGLPPPPRQ